jgi:hypothetical protein
MPVSVPVEKVTDAKVGAGPSRSKEQSRFRACVRVKIYVMKIKIQLQSQKHIPNRSRFSSKSITKSNSKGISSKPSATKSKAVDPLAKVLEEIEVKAGD